MKHPARVAITIRSFDLNGPAMAKLQEQCTISYTNTTGRRLTEDELARAVGDSTGVIAGTESFSAPVLRQCRSLRIISRVGVGTDSIDLEAAASLGIRVATTPNSPGQAVAEHTLALLLASLKRIPQYNGQMRKNDHSVVAGTLLSGKTVGIAGLGRVGTRVAEQLACLGCRIGFYDPLFSREQPPGWKRYASLGEMVGDADILSIHSAPLPDGSPLVTAEVLSRARGITIVNTARGSLIDEAALIQALSTGAVSAAALDVFPSEPYTGKLLAFPQVIVTPHVASNTAESRSLMEMEAADNCIHYLKEVDA
jgi:D-3-phosphoglycerate dehydrogenase / 2-oxoglutarate reductase